MLNAIKRFVVRVLTPALAHRLVLYVRGLHPSQMWGRRFDVNRSRLAELEGLSLFVMPNDFIGHSILTNKEYEPHVTFQIRNLLKSGDVFLDLGANIGYFSILASTIVGQSGKVIAFEPNPTNVQLIYRTIQQRGISNLLVYPLAVSSARQVLRFTTVGSNGGVVTPHSKRQQYELLVQSVTVDEMLSSEPRIDLVKMDLEAHEPYALQGMHELIQRCRPKIVTEFHPWAMQLNNLESPETYLQQLSDLGYELSIVLPSGSLQPATSKEEVMDYWRSLRQASVQLDLLATPIER